MKNPDISSLEHTSWRCQYHVVFAMVQFESCENHNVIILIITILIIVIPIRFFLFLSGMEKKG